jgi:flagellar hook-basal body complex protein FliE
MELISKLGSMPMMQPMEISSPKVFGEKEGGSSFMSYLEKSMGEVNQLLNDSDNKATDLALGKTENLHESMVAGEKAETAFKLMVQFRTKAIEAYNEIIRMQV